MLKTDGSIDVSFVVGYLDVLLKGLRELSSRLRQATATPMLLTELSLVTLHLDRAIKEAKQLYD